MFLNYHQIEPEFSSHVYGVTVETLRKHLEAFAAHASTSSRKGGITGGITFDDGHISNYDHALPQLEKTGVRATFFIVASFVGTKADTMNAAQLRELISLGHEIGSHSWSHPVLPQCSSKELMDQLVRSREVLAGMIGREVTAISMPHGNWNKRVVETCKEAGYSQVYTSDFRRGESTIAGLTVRGRLTVRRTMTAERIGEFLDARGVSLWALAAPYVAKDAIKGILGQDLYHKIWKQTLGRKRGGQAEAATAATSREISGKL
jgi:peptidoglycan/xylan/chitin deacetylase (PgdA/CDA1 family)